MVTPAALHSAPVPTVQSGLDVLLHHRLGLLRGRRVGVLAHQASVNARLEHAVALLAGVRSARLITLFAPEHGVWGAPQDLILVGHERDPVTGLRVTSLYGQRREPTEAMLRGLDVLVIDLQDIGARYYTYQWTMALALRACARVGVRALVLDRPNPLGGVLVEGNVPDPAFASFVGLYPLPARPGLTLGEIARYLNARHALGAQLEVVAMRGWRRRMLWEDTGLPWVPRRADPRYRPRALQAVPHGAGCHRGGAPPGAARVSLAAAALRVRVAEAADRHSAGDRRDPPRAHARRVAARDRAELAARPRRLATAASRMADVRVTRSAPAPPGRDERVGA